MKNEITIGLGGLLLAALTYFAGVWRTEKRHDTIDKRDRMDAVFNRYMDYRKSKYTAGIHGLQISGVATLVSDKEIRELADRIVAHNEKDPLERHTELFNNINLKVFFDYSAKIISILSTRRQRM